MTSENISFFLKKVDMYFKKRALVAILAMLFICDLCKN